MKKHIGIKVERTGNVYTIIRDACAKATEAGAREGDWQHRSAFATEARPLEATGGTYKRMADLIISSKYADAARLADRCGDRMLKMRTCMDGVRHYAGELSCLSREADPYSESRAVFEKMADLHEKIAELYLLFGNREKADAHMNMSLQMANGIAPECK